MHCSFSYHIVIKTLHKSNVCSVVSVITLSAAAEGDVCSVVSVMTLSVVIEGGVGSVILPPCSLVVRASAGGAGGRGSIPDRVTPNT